MDSVDATWTRPGEVLTLDAGWTDSVVVHLTVDANLWDQTRPQLFVRMDAGTVRVDGALVLDRTGPWLWGRHQQVDLPHEAAVDGLVEILVEPLPTTHFWILPAARVDALHVGDAAALVTLEYQTFGAPKDVSTIASTYAIPWLLGVALLWLWWHRRDALLLWFAIGILAMASANGLTHLAQSELIPYVPGFAVAATLVFATAGAGYSGFLARTFSPDLRWVTVGVPSLVFAIYIVRGIAPTMWGPGTLETLLYLLLLGIGLWRRQRGVGWFIFALAFFVAGELVVLAVRTEMMDDAWLYWKAALQAMAVALTVFAMVMLLIDRLVRNLEAAEQISG